MTIKEFEDWCLIHGYRPHLAWTPMGVAWVIAVSPERSHTVILDGWRDEAELSAALLRVRELIDA